MATTLDEHQFEILSETADTGVAFGIGLDVSCDATGFDPGSNDWLIQDQQDPFSGATRMGRDVQTGSTFTWSLHVNKDDEEGALDALDALADAWAPEGLSSADAMVLRYRIGGRTRRVYGRPRRFASTPDNRILGGMIPVTADFKRVDPLFYDDSPESITLGVAYESEGGFIFPVTFPVMTLPGGYHPGEAFVSGRRKTWPIIRLDGPLVNPQIQTADWNLNLTLTLNEGHYVEIDTRPWKRTITLDGTSSIPGAINVQTRLRDLFLSPGHQSFGFRAISDTGTGSATISWYPAYASL
jgi:Uncharacterized protein conserved in bacteria